MMQPPEEVGGPGRKTEMDDTPLEDVIMRALYEARYGTDGDDSLPLRLLAHQVGRNEARVMAACNVMIQSGIVEGRGIGSEGISVALSPYGALTAEERKLVPGELAEHNRSVRTRILDAMVQIHEMGQSVGAAWPAIVEKAQVSHRDFHSNIDILQTYGLVEHPGIGVIRITDRGMQKVLEWRQRRQRLTRLYGLKGSPDAQARGHALEALLAEAIADEGWGVESGVRAKGEETDLLVSCGTEYYLVECKWHARAIGASVYREFLSRVTARMGVRGVLISMSSFTSGTVDAARTRMSDGIIVLFGPSDVESVVTGTGTFRDLLAAKLHALEVISKVLPG